MTRYWLALCATAVSAVKLGASCSPLELIIARGTSEPPAPTYGVIVGDPLFAATQALIPNVTGYAVNYPASLSCDSRSTGINDTVAHLNSQSIACPRQQYVLVGYSQGADIMHFAAERISPALFPRIVALVMYGDPGNRGPGNIDPLGGLTFKFPDFLASRLKQNCGAGDCVCTNNGTDIEAHLSYNNAGTTWAQDSAKYIQKQLSKRGFAGPESAGNPGCQTPENVVALSSLGAALGGTLGLPECGTKTATATSACSTATTPTKVAAVAATTPANLIVARRESIRPSR